MSKILIVGNSSEVILQIKAVLKQEPSASVTLFCTESVLPYHRHLLPAYIAKDVKEAGIYPEHDRFFAEHHIEVISNEKLARLSLKRKYLTTESKRQISYDRLLLVDTGFYKVPEIKGHHKKGVFDGFSLTAMKALHKALMDIETVFLTVTHTQGLNLACTLARQKKEVVVSASSGLLANIFDDEAESLLRQIMEANGVRIIDQDIEEILGDTDVKAVRLKSGKVMSAQAVIFDQVAVDVSMLSDVELPEGNQRIYEDIFNQQTLPLLPTRFGLGLLDGFACGITYLPEGGREYLRFNGPENIFKKIYVLNEKLMGAVVFNAPSFVQPLSDLIISGEPISGKEEALLENF